MLNKVNISSLRFPGYFLLNIIVLIVLMGAIWQDMIWGIVLLISFLLLFVAGFFFMIMQFLPSLFIMELPFVEEGAQVRKFAVVMAMGLLMIGFVLATMVIFYPERVTHYAPGAAVLFLVCAIVVVIVADIREQSEQKSKPSKPNKSLGTRK